MVAVERGMRYRPMLKVAVEDEGQGTLVLRFFHFRQQQVGQFAVGNRLRCFGTPKPGHLGLEIVHPSYQVLGRNDDPELGDRLDPVYPTVEGVGPMTMRKLIGQALDRLPEESTLELLPSGWLDGLGLPSLRSALLTVHRPPPDADLAALAAGTHPAQRRLAMEELLAHHLSLRRQRIALQAHHAPPLAGPGKLAKALLKQLPFALTGAQARVFKQIREDLARPSPMLRLVQGDVGSGKTVVAALAAMLAVEQGKQVALAAPTELLAEQHLNNLRGWLEPLGVRIAWLAGKVTGKARAKVMEQVANGEAQVVVGTHALMQEAVVFQDLALAIVDEQHRFGVHQRLALRDKGAGGNSVPHQLVMTATPIPRTLAMSEYADLDVSAIDELPPGRTPVQTVALNNDRRPELIERIALACQEGRQVYGCARSSRKAKSWMPPRTGNLRITAGAAARRARRAGAWPPESRREAGDDGGVQGRRHRPAGRNYGDRSGRGRTERLVDGDRERRTPGPGPAAPAAWPCWPRFGGIALRAAVPGAAFADGARTPADHARNQRWLRHRRKDLELRGPGELLGTRQTGLAGFRIADLARDAGLLPGVHDLAERLLAQQPALADRVVQRWIGTAVRYASA